MSENQLLPLKKELTLLCQDLGKFIRSEMNKVKSSDIEEKDLNSLVSYVDKEAERKIVERLTELTPEAGFITEEKTIKSKPKAMMWIIDPLDGTTNFLRKIPHFSTSIALSQNGEIVLGIVYEIMLDTAYTAIKNKGAWENDNKISVSKNSDPSKAIAVTGFPYKRHEDVHMSMELLKHCVLNYRGVRRLGSAALDLAYVASGKIDIYYEKSLNTWDLAAGCLLVEEAGGKVSDYDGDNKYLDKGAIISSNGFLYDNIFGAIKEYVS